VTLGTFGAGDVVYGLSRYEALCRCGIFPAEILPDRLLVSELSLMGTIKHVPDAMRFRRVFPTSDPAAALIRRQLSTLGIPAERHVRPHLSHATYFVRRFLQAPADDSPSRRMQRLYHALLYFQRQFNKYRTECVRELELPDPFGELAPLVEFLRAVLARKWRFLYQDYAALAERVRETQARMRQFKALRDTLEEKIGELEARNAEAERTIARLNDERRHPVRQVIRIAANAIRRPRPAT
jgi:cell division protein FtsB